MCITAKQFTCVRDGMTIRGMQHFPEQFDENRKYPAVIASHGFLCNYTSMENWCRSFAEIGYVAFCFSFCGGGNQFEDKALKSDGESTKMTILTEVEDLLAVKSFACRQAYVDMENLVLLGESQGGFVSGLAAARCGAEMQGGDAWAVPAISLTMFRTYWTAGRPGWEGHFMRRLYRWMPIWSLHLMRDLS